MQKNHHSLYFWEYALHITYMANTTKPTSMATLANVLPCMSCKSPLDCTCFFSIIREAQKQSQRRNHPNTYDLTSVVSLYVNVFAS